MRSLLYRIASLCVLATFVAGAAPSTFAQTKKPKSPRALAVIRWQPDAKGNAVPYLLPFAILVDGKFYDANIYLASPRPLAVEPGNIYEAQDLGQILGLFTIERATEVAGMGARNWLAFGRWENQAPSIDYPLLDTPSVASIPPKTPALQPPPEDDDVHKKTSVTYDENGKPVENPKDDEPTRDKRGRIDPIERMPRPAPDKKPEPETKPQDDPDRPRYKRPAGTTMPPSTTPEPQTKAAPPVTKATVEAPAPGGPIRSDEDPNRPVLKRGVSKVAREEKPEAYGGGPVPERVRERGGSMTAKGPVYEVAAFSDEDTTENKQFFRYPVKEDERADLQSRMIVLAEQEMLKYLSAQEKATGITTAAPHPPASRRGKRPARPQISFSDVRFHVMDLDHNNAPELVLSARYDRPDAPAMFLTLVARADVNLNPRRLLVRITAADKLDALPRLEFVDAIDADGNAIGDLLFRQVHDGYADYVLYRVDPDGLTELFHGGAAD